MPQPDRPPATPEPLGSDARTLFYLAAIAVDLVTYPLKVFRRARGPRTDPPLTRLGCLLFPLVTVSFGFTCHLSCT